MKSQSRQAQVTIICTFHILYANIFLTIAIYIYYHLTNSQTGRDLRPRERRPPARLSLQGRHDVHDALALRHVHGRLHPLQDPASRARREQDFPRWRVVPQAARR
jgi:hypothetical protein